ncbi:TldD/PmbA family protein [Octadecabacter sp. 1_MG-2023]|uniref:TldD/PmbA family protein n=1 Tax=unclassified Octadecabacter TaxID=196158 RepID=UPI001C07FE73|nr:MULTISPECIES: TldD/PmbA family protein [unclassified Octadecabacter]MBU2992177.1 TldD/PmbA family protein [Octadecabacter sp. B2R22]MDO6735067.1 TldD/PmbA family protein [Octadecabacter sp. 1_MG-2023]
MTQSLADLTHRLIEAAKAAGADTADALAVAGTSVSIDVRSGVLEEAQRAEGTDVGLRVFVGQRSANVSASDTSERTIAEMAQRAVAMAAEAPEDPHAGIADPSQLATDLDVSRLDLVDHGPEPTPEWLQEQARIAEEAAQSVDGVAQVQTASAGYGRRQVHLATSNGFSAGSQSTGHSISAVAIAGSGSGMERDYDHDSRIHLSDMRAADDIGRIAGERAVARHGARKPQTGTYPVLFDERIAGSLIGHLLSASNGAAIARGSSWLLGKNGERVLPEGMDLIETPHRPRVAGSRLFDGEGLPTAQRKIIDDGVLTGWTLDLATGRKLGLPSTGSASRGTSGPPSPTVSHLELTPGKASPDEIIRDMGTGLLITSMIGSTINPNTGDYSRGASGFWIENGEIAYPINECTVAGNLHDMLARIIPSNDGRAHMGRIIPSLMIDEMTLAGA